MLFLIEFINYIKKRKKFWLIPLFLVLIVFGWFLIIAQNSVLAPFIYTIFYLINWNISYVVSKVLYMMQAILCKTIC